MTRAALALLVLVVLFVLRVLLVAAPQNPTFRSSTTSVAVDVSVRSGNVPVPDLTSADFKLTDNGVSQQIEAVALAAVPVDISLVVDVSGSTFQQLQAYRRDVTAIAAVLRPIDSLRVIALESAVHEIVPLTPATGSVSVDLVVGYTDGMDNRSLMTGDQVLAMGKTSEAVLHLVSPGTLPTIRETDKPCEVATRRVAPVGFSSGVPACPQPPLLQQAVEVTGGRVHIGAEMAGPFRSIFRDFLNSYVLYFQPAGVAPAGWHELSVSVIRRGRYTVRARRGCFAGGSVPR